MTQNLKGKVLTVIGGNGFVGGAICRHASAMGAKVYAISRSGAPKTQDVWTSQINWIKGNAMNPDTYEDVLKETDALVHTLGVLLDSSITHFKRPGEPGTYEQINREAAKVIGKKLSDLKNKKMVYISGAQHPPFIPRYLTTKIEAEEFLFNLPELRTTSLRPGFIHDSKIKSWTGPLHYGVDLYASVYGVLSSFIPNNEFIKVFARNFNVEHSIDLDSVAVSAIISAFNPKYDGKILFRQDMIDIKEDYNRNGLKLDQQ